MTFCIKRIYEPVANDDGMRILVDRIWPQGITRFDARIARWDREVAPTTELRRWFGHKPERWTEFQKRYLTELQGNPAFEELRGLARGKPTTLLYGAKDETYNQARVLADRLDGR